MFSLLLVMGCLRPPESELTHQLDREIIALRQRNALLKDAAENCDQQDVVPEVFTQLRQVFATEEVTVERQGLFTRVVIPGSLLFSPGSVQVRAEAMMVLDLLSTAINLHADQHVWVIGHTDATPINRSLSRYYRTNWELSSARANSIMYVLVDQFSVTENRFTIAGRGDSAPLGANDTPAGREQNRRVEVVIGPADHAW